MFAIVQLLYPNDACFLEALVSAKSIHRSGTRADLILLCDKGVPQWQQDLLKEYYTKVILIDDYAVSKSLFASECLCRYGGVFNKLYAFALEQYDKILLLDLDTVVLHNLDRLFSIPAPAAHFGESKLEWEHGIKMEPELIRYRTGQSNKYRSGGYMNIGVCLIEPSLELFNALDQKLQKIDKKEHDGLTFVEQEFIRDYFINDWHQLSRSYNFLVANLPSVSQTRGKHYLALTEADVNIIHYIYCWKPIYFRTYPTELKQLGKYFPQGTIEELIKMTNGELEFPSFDEATSGKAKFQAVMGIWYQLFEPIREQLGTRLETLKVPFYFTPEEHSAHVKWLDRILGHKKEPKTSPPSRRVSLRSPRSFRRAS